MIQQYFILCIHVVIYTLLIFTLEYVENVHGLVYALPAGLLVCTVRCDFAFNIIATAHCTRMCFWQRLQFCSSVSGYETKDNSMLSTIAFNKSMIHLSSRKYWHSISRIAKLEPAKRFWNMVRDILCSPSSSAGIERLYSSAALVRQSSVVSADVPLSWERKCLLPIFPKEWKKNRTILRMALNSLPI